MCNGVEHDVERYLSTGSLLSSGKFLTHAVSSGNELIVDGFDAAVGLSIVYSWVLLSTEWNSVCNEEMFGGSLLSIGNSVDGGQHIVSNRSVLSRRKSRAFDL